MIEKFREYLIQDDKSKNTIENYIRHIQSYFKWCEDSFGEAPGKLYRQNILEYKSYLQNVKKDSPSTINARISALIKLNEFLQDHGIQEDLVVSKKDAVRVQKEVASPAKVDKKQVEAFRQRVLEEEGDRNYAIVTILAYAGLRISEVLNLKTNDINFTSRELVVRNGKGDKQRIVYINSKIIEAVKEYLKHRKESNQDYLFVSSRENRLDRTVINKMFNKYSDIITPHTLRHFYCTNALESGYSVHEVANQAGHTNINTTLIYTNPTKEKIKQKADLL